MEVSDQLHDPAALLLGEEALGNRWTGVWILQSWSEQCGKEKISGVTCHHYANWFPCID